MVAATRVTTLRPGAQLGAYPEKSTEQNSNNARHSLVTPFQRHCAATRGRALTRFVKSVHEHAPVYAKQASEQMGPCIDELRTALVKEGLSDLHVARCFALVRELAGRELSTPHYDTQLMAGRVMITGGLAEMQTGEGKRWQLRCRFVPPHWPAFPCTS